MTTQNLSLNERNQNLNKVIDRLLNQIFGHEATQIIYNHLESNYSIQRNEIAEKLASFNGALERYLGTGAFVIEKVIYDNLEENTEVNFVERQRLLKLA